MKIIENNPYRILGVYANSPVRERVANHNRLKAFLNVGRQITFPLDLNSCLLSITRTTETIDKANADLTLPNDQLKYAQFWFIKSTPFDEIAFNHLFAGNMANAIDIWSKKDNVSSLQNRIVCALIKADNNSAVKYAETLYTQYANAFIPLVLGNSTTIKSDGLDLAFIDMLSEEVGVDKILPYVTNASWEQHLGGKVIDPLINNIQSAIDKAKGTRKQGSAARLKAGRKLMRDTKPLLAKLKKFLPSTDLRYQMIADKLAQEILQCGIDYFNASNDDDAPQNAMELQIYALSIAVGKMAKDRCKENVDILQKNIDRLPPKEIKKEVDELYKELKYNHKYNEDIEDVFDLLKSCSPYIKKIKNIYGKDNSLYLELSTTVVNYALDFIIKCINQKQEEIKLLNQEVSNYNLFSNDQYMRNIYLTMHAGKHRVRSAEEINDDIKEFRKSYKKMLRIAWKAIKRMETFDMKEDFKRNRFMTNKETLLDMCNSYWVYTSLFAFMGNISFTRVVLWLILIATGFLIYVLNA